MLVFRVSSQENIFASTQNHLHSASVQLNSAHMNRRTLGKMKTPHFAWKAFIFVFLVGLEFVLITGALEVRFLIIYDNIQLIVTLEYYLDCFH